MQTLEEGCRDACAWVEQADVIIHDHNQMRGLDIVATSSGLRWS